MNEIQQTRRRLDSAEKVEKIPKESYGLAMGQLKSWRDERKTKLLDKESTKQGIAVGKVIGFLNAIGMAVKLQTWFRMVSVRQRYYEVLAHRRGIKYAFLRAWKINHKVDLLFRFHTLGKFYLAWKGEMTDSKRLKKLIHEFFKICIKRLRLTPQACMAYFNPGEWTKDVTHSDMMKIRRLMLMKLLQGWKAETRELRIVRAKATQVLSRMVRRTKGPLWVKESSLVCFHMWHRYTAVKRAYRLEEPDPRFQNPYLPQWTKLFKEITLSRVKKKRSLEAGHRLTEGRSFRVWKHLMSVDRSKPVTPLAVAIMHYSRVIRHKILLAWYGVVRERGKLIRFRNDIFGRWKKWAPQNKKLWEFNGKALLWLRLKQMRRAYNVMVDLCLDVISKRTERMKVLRRNFCDRKVVICAYALMNKNEHVLFVDCWRRLHHYWQCRRNWKAYKMHHKYHWHMAKVKAIFHAWKTHVAVKKDLKNSTIPAMRELFARPQFTSHGGALANDEIQTDDQSCDDNSSVGSYGGAGHTYLTEFPGSPGGVGSWDASSSPHHQLSGSNTGNNTPKTRGGTSGGGQMRSRAGTTREKKRLRRAPPVIDYQNLVNGYVPVGYDLIQQAMEGTLSVVPNESQFQLFCLAITQSQNRILAAGAGAASGQSNTAATAATANKPGTAGSVAPGTASTTGTRQSFVATDTTALLKQLNAPVVEPLPVVSTTGTKARGNSDVSINTLVYSPALQQKLQRGIDEMDMTTVLSAVSEGATIEPRHVKQVAIHIGDQYLPLFALLLTGSTHFMAERVVKRDGNPVLNTVQNPINAFLLGSQVDRWTHNELTRREVTALTENKSLQDTLAGPYATISMWHNIVLKIIDIRAEQLALTCKILPEARTVDEEVVEVLKRKKIERLNAVHASLSSMFGLTVPETDRRATIPALVVTAVVPHTGPMRKSQLHIEQHLERDIYTVLREFTLMTGKLTNEGKALRGPLLERDQTLIVNGFLKQARADFLALRRSCMTPAQLAAEAEKLAKAELKAKKLAEKGKKKPKKKKKSKKGGKKKAKKGAKGAGNRPRSASSGSDTDGSGTDDDDEYNTSGASSADESSEAISVRYNDYYYDGQFLHSANEIENLPEESDILLEKEYQKRVSAFQSPVYTETWLPMYSRHNVESTLATLVERYTKEMKCVVKRVVDILQCDENIGKFDFPEARALFGGIGQYIIDKGAGDAKCRSAASWAVMPKDWWSFKLIKSRLNRELAVVEGTMVSTKKKISTHNDKNDELEEEAEGYEKYLKKIRKEILKISQKRNEKTAYDKVQRSAKAAMLKKAERNIVTTKSKLTTLTEKLRLAEIYFAAGNARGVIDLLKPPPPPETAAETASNAGKDTKKDAKESTKDTAKDSKKDTKKSKPKGKKGEADDGGDSDGSEDSISIYGLLEDAKNQLAALKESLPVLETKRFKLDCELRDYDNACYRTTKMLKTLAEDRFNTMVEVQSLVIRTNKNYDICEENKEVYSKARKRALKYFKQLKAFHDLKLQARGNQLAREAEARRLSELMRRPDGLGTRQSSSNSLVGGPDTPTRKQRGTFMGEDSPSGRPVAARFNPNQSTASNSLEGLNILPDIVVTEEELEAYNAGRMSPESVDTGVSFDYDDLEAPDMTSDRNADDAQRPNRPNRKHDDLNASNGSHNNSHESLNVGEYRPLTIDEEILLLHHNSIENRKRREEDLKRAALLQAEEALAQELKMKVFDDYWTALPRKHDTDDMSNANHDSPRKKERNARKSVVEPVSPTKVDPAAVTKILSKTAKMWASVGKQYWRTKEETIKSLVENEILNSASDDEDGNNNDNINFESQDDYDLAGVSRTDHILAQRKARLQAEILAKKVDLFEENVYIDTRKDTDLQEPDAQTGLPYRVSHDFAHMSDAVWKVSTPIIMPTIPGKGAPIVPTLSVSIRELLERRGSTDGSVVTELKPPADDSQAATRSRGNSRQGTKKSLLKDKDEGEGDDDDGSKDGTGSATSAIAAKVDQFSTVGRLEYLRYKAGMQSKAALAMADDDVASYSVESRTGSIDSVVRRNTEKIANVERIGGFGGDNLAGIAEHGFQPQSVGALIDGGYVVPALVADENAFAGDDMSEMSIQSSVVSQSSSVANQRHQKQVDQYLNLIEQPHEMNNINAENVNIISGETPQQATAVDKQQFGESVHISAEQSVASSKSASQVKSETTPPPQPPQPLEKVEAKLQNASSQQTTERAQTTPLKTKTSPEKFNKSVTKSTEKPTTRATISAGNMSAMAQTAAGVANKTQKLVRFGTEGGAGKDKDTPATLSPTKGTNSNTQKTNSNSSSSSNLPAPLNRSSSAPIRHTIQATHPSNQQQQSSSPKIISSPKVVIKSIMKDSFASGTVGAQLKSQQSPQLAVNNGISQERSVSLPADDETSEISMEENLEAAAVWAEQEGSFPSSPMAVQIMRQDSQESDTNEVDSLPSIQISINNRGSPLIGRKISQSSTEKSSHLLQSALVNNNSNNPTDGNTSEVPSVHLERVRKAADQSRTSIKVKRNGPVHNAHEQFLPSSYPIESQLELINASPDRALSKSGLRIDTTVPARHQQEADEGDGTALTTYLEMPAILDLTDMNHNATQQEKKLKKRLIFSDSPMSARLPHHSNHTNNNSSHNFENTNIPPSAQHPMDVNGKYLAVSVNGQWQLQSPPKTHGHGHTIAGSTNAHSIASTRHASPLKADPSGVSSAEHSPRPEFMVSGTKLLRSEEGLGEDSLDSALGDHDLLDVDSVVGNRLASRLGLRPSVSPPRDRRASSLSVPLLNVDGSVASEDDLSYDNLLNLVKEFKTEQKLLRDREVAIVQETPTVSFYPANFRQHLMIPKKPEVAESLTVNTTTHAGGSNAGLSATAKVDRSNVSTPVKTPSKKRNRNLTRSFDKHVLTAAPTTPDKDSQGVAAAANLAHTLSTTTNNNISASAGTTQSSEVTVRKEGILSRKNTSQGSNTNSSGNINNINSTSSSSSHFSKADVEKALTKYMTQHYTNLNPNDIHGAPLSEVDIQAAADSIRQYLQNQEEAAHVPPHSPGALSRLHSRQLAREYRTALSFDSTLEGQGGMFFKDEHALSPSNTAPLGSNHYRDNRHSRGASVSPHRNHNISSPGYFPSGGHFNAGQYHIDHTGTGGSHTADGTYTAGSSVELKRAGSAQFWVEVIKLLHPENEHFDDEDSSLATEPRSKTPRQVSRPQFNANVVPDMSVDVIKLSHPQIDTIYGNENRTASPGTGFAGIREMNRSGSLTGSRTGAPESFAAGLQGMVSAAQLHNHDTLNERQHKLRNSASEQLVPPNYVVEENLDHGQSHGDKLSYSHSDGQLLHLAPVVQQAKRWPAPATIAAQQAAENRLRSSQSRLARNMDRSASPPHNIDNNETDLQLSARDAHGNYIGSRAQSPGSPTNLTARGNNTVTSPGGTVYNLGYNDDSRPISPGSPSQRVAKQNTYGLSDGFRLTTLATTHYKFDGDAPSADTIPLPPDNVLVGTAATMSPSPAGSRPQTPSGSATLRKQYSATRVLGTAEESVGGRPVSGSPTARANLKRLGTNSKIPPINELGAGPQPDEASVQSTSGRFNDSHLVDSGLVEHSLASVQIISEIAGEFYNVNNSLSNGGSGSQILQQQTQLATQALQSPTKQPTQPQLSGTSKPHLHPLDTNSIDNVSTNISAAGSPYLSGFNNSTANSSVAFNNNNLNSNSNSLLFNTNSAYNVNSSFSAPIFEGLKVQPLAPPAPDNVSIYSKNSLNEAQKILALNTDHVKVDHTNNNNINNALTRSNSNNNNSRSPPRSPLHSRKQSTSHNANIPHNNIHSNNNSSRDLLASPPRSPQAHAKKTTKHNKTHTANNAHNSEIAAAGLADLITITKSSAQQQNTLQKQTSHDSAGSLFYPSDQEGQLHNVDGDDNSSIHTTRSAILKSNYLFNANSNKNKSMTLDDYMRMKERQTQYHTTEDGDKNINSGTDVPQRRQQGSINQPHESSELGVISLQAAKRRLQVSSSGAKTDTYDDSAMNSALNSALNSARTAEQEQTIIRKPVVKVQNLSAPNSLELNINGTAKPPAVKVPNSSRHGTLGQHSSAQQEEDEVSLMSQLGPQEPQMTEEEAEALMERELRAMLKSAQKSEETTQYLNSAAALASANKFHLAGSQSVPFLAGNGGVSMHNSTAKRDKNNERKGKIAPSSLHSSQSQKQVQLPPLSNANITPPTSAGSVGTVYRGLGDVLHGQKLLKPLKKNALHSNPELNELLYAKTSNSMASMGGSGRGFGLGSGLPPKHGLTMSALPSDYSGGSGNMNVTGNSNSRNSRINSVTSILSQNSMRSMKETMPVTPTVEFKNKKKPLL